MRFYSNFLEQVPTGEYSINVPVVNNDLQVNTVLWDHRVTLHVSARQDGITLSREDGEQLQIDFGSNADEIAQTEMLQPLLAEPVGKLVIAHTADPGFWDMESGEGNDITTNIQSEPLIEFIDQAARKASFYHKVGRFQPSGEAAWMK